MKFSTLAVVFAGLLAISFVEATEPASSEHQLVQERK